MSTISSDDHLNPQSPLYYAPRRVRETPQRPSFLDNNKRSDRLRRPASEPYDALLEDAVASALRHPLDPEVVREPPGFANEREGRKPVLRIVVRTAAAITAAAAVAFFFAFMIPAAQDRARQADGSASSITGMIESAKAALSNPASQSAAAKPAASEVETILASSRTEQQPAATHEQSETILKQFLQWQGKPTQSH